MTDEPVIRILHLSDLHFSEDRRWDSEPVLSGLVEKANELDRNRLAPDVVVITGDIAQSGKPSEYRLASE
jgi:3',5'-cyclic AMP phosphodiesterase CpdA